MSSNENTQPRRGRGRPRLYDDKCIMVSIRLNPSDRDLLKSLSGRLGQSQSRVIAAAIRMIDRRLDEQEARVEI